MTDRPDPGGDGPVELLALALSRPNDALDRARALFASRPGPLAESVARQVVGIVMREFGDIDGAVHELRTARRLAHRAGAAEREVDVLATLGTALVLAGRTRAGRRALDEAMAGATGQLLGRVAFRRGGVHYALGSHGEALADLDAAVAALGSAGDRVWQGRAVTARGFVHLAQGHVRAASADLETSERLFAETGQELELVDAIGNRGVLALAVGDIPSALARFDEAAEHFAALDVPDLEFRIPRCSALLAAGLPRDALAEAEAAVAEAERLRLRPTHRA